MKNIQKPENRILKHIGRKMKDARHVKSLTQSDVSNRIDSDANYYAKIERGEVAPSLKTLIKIADVLEIEYSELFPKRSKK